MSFPPPSLTSYFALVAVVASAGCLDAADDLFAEQRKDCAAVLSSGIAFSEVLASGGVSGGDFIEVFNPSPTNIEMTGVMLHLRAGDAGEADVAIGFEDDEIEIGGGGYFVFTGTPHDLRPSYANFGYGNALGALPASGTVALSCDGEVFDAFSWSGGGSNRSLQLAADVFPTPETNDIPGAVCLATRQFVEGRYGTPGTLNSPCFEPERLCIDANDNYRAKREPIAGDLVITEVMPDPTAAFDEDGEWFELYARESVDLNDLFFQTASTQSPPLASERCLPLLHGQRTIFARSRFDARLPRVDFEFDFALVNSGVSLGVFHQATLLDSVALPAASPGRSFELDPDDRSATANDDLANWCFATELQPSGDLGSPGTRNTGC